MRLLESEFVVIGHAGADRFALAVVGGEEMRGAAVKAANVFPAFDLELIPVGQAREDDLIMAGGLELH